MTTQEIIKTFIDHDQIPKNIDQKTLLSDILRIKFDNVYIDTSFYIEGTNGTGKTHFTTLYLRDWICAKFPNGYQNYRYAEVPDFIKMVSLENYIKNCFGFENDLKCQAKARLKDLKESQLLIIDDFQIIKGTQKESTDFKNVMFEIFDYRFENKLQTIITTNLDLAKLGDIDPFYTKISSRILGLCQKLELENKLDLRLKTPAIVENKESFL